MPLEDAQQFKQECGMSMHITDNRFVGAGKFTTSRNPKSCSAVGIQVPKQNASPAE